MTEGNYFIGFLLLWASVVLLSLLMWTFWIRRYVVQHGRSPGHGANIGWTILADASTATDIARETRSMPWFLVVFWIVEIFVWAVPIAGVILLGVTMRK